MSNGILVLHAVKSPVVLSRHATRTSLQVVWVTGPGTGARYFGSAPDTLAKLLPC